MNNLAQIDIFCESLADTRDSANIAFKFNEEERPFVRVPTPVHIPSFPVHHNPDDRTPDRSYLERLTEVLDSLSSHIPQLFANTRLHFDPARTLQPVFFRTLTDRVHTAILRAQLDLSIYPGAEQIIRNGNNDYTAEYETTDLYIDIDIVPVNPDTTAIRRVLHETWIGEHGRGYFAQGIWIDRDLTRFFTALVEPSPAQLYPYYPFSASFRTVSHRPPTWYPEELDRSLGRLCAFLDVVSPAITEIEETFRHTSFSRDMPLLHALTQQIPSWISRSFSNIRCKRSLTVDDLMEYTLERTS